MGREWLVSRSERQPVRQFKLVGKPVKQPVRRPRRPVKQPFRRPRRHVKQFRRLRRPRKHFRRPSRPRMFSKRGLGGFKLIRRDLK